MAYGTNAPNGFVPRSYLNGAPWTGKVNYYLINPSTATSIFKGDIVRKIPGNTGFIEAYVPTNSIGTASDSPSLGVFISCQYTLPTATGTTTTFVPAGAWIANTKIAPNTSILAAVADDPMTVFDVQSNGAMTFAQMGGNAGFTGQNNGNPVNGLSGEVIDFGTVSQASAGSGWGSGTLTGTTAVVIAAPYVSANSVIAISPVSALGGTLTVTKNPGAGFSVVSSDGGDTMDFTWQVNPDPAAVNYFYPLRLLYATPIPNKNPYEIQYNNICVLINNHAYKQGTQAV